MPALRTRGRGTTADAPPAKPRSDAYVGLLVIALLAQLAGILFLYLDWSEYGGQAPPKTAPVSLAPAPGVAAPSAAPPTVGGPQAGPGIQQGGGPAGVPPVPGGGQPGVPPPPRPR
jgi:hypothetical protein